MNQFEDRLLDDLLQRHGAVLDTPVRPRARYAGRRRTLAAAGALALAGAAAAVIATSGGPEPAYAISRNADGTVTVTIRDIAAIAPANARLAELGVRARAVPMTADCPDLDSHDMYRGSDWHIEARPDGSVTLGQDLPAGYTVLLSFSDRAGRGTGLGFTGPVRDPAPNCLRDPAA
jgi:hypothetical protein